LTIDLYSQCKFFEFAFHIQIFQIPIKESFFYSLTGSTLLLKEQMIPTATLLSNKRLIAFYFSAHWCPPCRQLTPMLCEFYNHIKKIMPTAIEIVFVTSDRDSSNFGSYFRQMPWVALPYENLKSLQQLLSARYVL
jgi:nucleoredoxin